MMDALEQARREIDTVDAQLAALFERRMKAVLSVAEYKKAHGLPIFDAAREKVVLDKASRALYFSRATIPWHRDGFAQSRENLPQGYVPLRHIGLYAYSNAFLQAYPQLSASPLEAIEALEQLRVLWHGHAIAVHVTDSAPAAGVDTPEDLERVQAHYRAL